MCSKTGSIIKASLPYRLIAGNGNEDFVSNNCSKNHINDHFIKLHSKSIWVYNLFIKGEYNDFKINSLAPDLS